MGWHLYPRGYQELDHGTAEPNRPARQPEPQEERHVGIADLQAAQETTKADWRAGRRYNSRGGRKARSRWNHHWLGKSISRTFHHLTSAAIRMPLSIRTSGDLGSPHLPLCTLHKSAPPHLQLLQVPAGSPASPGVLPGSSQLLARVVETAAAAGDGRLSAGSPLSLAWPWGTFLSHIPGDRAPQGRGFSVGQGVLAV